MSFSVRIAPGIRVRASSRGVRTSIGPRAARMHVGGGRTGVSTAFGPVSYYSSLGASSRRPPAQHSSRGSASAQRQLATAQSSADKAQVARTLTAALDAILNLHREEFAPAQPPRAPAPPAVDTAGIKRRHAKQAKAVTSVFARSSRRAALAVAEQQAEQEVAQVAARYESERKAWQQQLDTQWDALIRNDPETVLGALAAAFEDNEAAASAVGAHGSEITLVVVVPAPTSLPERQPTMTPAGNLSLKKLTKAESADVYKHLVCGHLLVTVKEAFAVAPSLTHARIVAIRAAPPDAYGKPQFEALLAASFDRIDLHHIQWRTADAVRVVRDASSELLMEEKGAARQLAPISLAGEPALRTVVAAVEADDGK